MCVFENVQKNRILLLFNRCRFEYLGAIDLPLRTLMVSTVLAPFFHVTQQGARQLQCMRDALQCRLQSNGDAVKPTSARMHTGGA
jgi:hypothetical protein